MPKYCIEGNIDFFSELYKSLDVEEENSKTEEDNNKCLITNLPLTDKYVTLECGHKFNYVPLIKDLINYNTRFIHMESNTYPKKKIRCPYCRTCQTKLLPYYEELGVKKMPGVNWDEHNVTGININNSHCEYINEFIGADGNLVKNKCNVYVNPIAYGSHLYNVPNCNKTYCGYHKKKVFNEYKKELVKENNLKKKEEKKKLKQEESLKKKLEKQAVKEAKQKSKNKNAKIETKTELISGNLTEKTENDVIENVVISQIGCFSILKSGLRKGQQCGCKIYQDNLCKKHYNMTNKGNVSTIIINNECPIDNSVKDNNNE